MKKYLFSAGTLLFALCSFLSVTVAQAANSGFCEYSASRSAFECYLEEGELPPGCTLIGGALSGGFACASVPTGYEDQTVSAPPPSAPPPSAPTGGGQSGNGNLTYVPLEPLPGVPQGGDANFADLITGFFKLLVNLGAFIAVTMLVIGGITYMISASTVTKYVAKEKVKAAFWGMAILAGAWLILNTINPQLLMFNRELVGPSATQNTNVGGPNASNSTFQYSNKFKDDCESSGGHVNLTPSGPVCGQ